MAARHLRVDEVNDAGSADDDRGDGQVTDKRQDVLTFGHRVSGRLLLNHGSTGCQAIFRRSRRGGGPLTRPAAGRTLPGAQIDLRHLTQTWRSLWPTWL